MSPLPAAATVPALLAEAQRRDPARPLVTFYDDATGERVELSVVTTANWVAKTASLLVEELDVERGDTVLVDLPTHWLTPVWLLACWTVGAVVAVPGTDAGADPVVVVSGPDRLADHAAASASSAHVIGVSLRPLGGPFAEPLPPGVLDFAIAVPGQPDAFIPSDPPSAEDPAFAAADGMRTHADLAQAGDASAERVLTDLSPTSDRGLALLLGAVAHGGSTVWVRHPDVAGWEPRASQERAARVERA